MKALRLSLSLFLTSILLNSCNESPESKKEKVAVAKLDQTLSDFKKKQREEFKKKGYIDHNSAANFDEIIQVSQELEKSTTGDNQAIAKVSSLILIQIQKDTQEISVTQEGLIEACDYSSIEKTADIQISLFKVRAYRKANRELKDKVNGLWREQLKGLLAQEGVSSINAADCLIGFDDSMSLQTPFLLTIRDSDEQLCQSVTAQLNLLNDNLGKWSWDSETKTPAFEDDATIKLYNIEAAKIAQASIQQTEAQEKILNL